MLAQPAKKATLLAAKMRIKLELVTFVFMVCRVLTAFDWKVESVSTVGVNNLFRLSRKCNNRARIAISAIAIACGLGDSGTLARVGCICPRRHDYLVETKESGYRVEQ
jgi:hypothetical protein